MKGMVRGIIIGIVVIFIGAGILIATYFISGKTWGTSEIEMKTATFSAENNTIKLNFEVGELKTEFYDGDVIKVDYPENNRFTTTFKEENGTLEISNGRRHWYDFLWSVNIPASTLYIPFDCVLNLDFDINAGKVTVAAGEYASVKLKVNAGALEIGDIGCGNFECKLNAGDMRANGVDCLNMYVKVNAGSLKLDNIICDEIRTEVNAGSAHLKIRGSEEEYSVNIDKNAGDCNISNRQGNTAKSIDGKVNAGSLSFEFI